MEKKESPEKKYEIKDSGKEGEQNPVE